MHAAHPAAQLEAQVGLVAGDTGDDRQAVAGDEYGQFADVDLGALDCGIGIDVVAREGGPQRVEEFIEVAAERGCGGAAEFNLLDQTAIAGGVAGAVGAEEAGAGADYLRVIVVLPADVAHRSSPLNSMVGRDASAACSAAAIASARLAPSGISWIFSCSLRIAWRSISGRGGQPGR